MTIQYFAYLRDITGCKQEQLSGASNLRALLCLLCAKHGDALREKLYKSGREGDGSGKEDLGQDELGNVIIMVNGRHINHLGGMTTVLTDSDTVQIFPVVAGG